MRAIGYVRVSTEEQALTGVSLDAQEEKIRAYCMVKDWELIRIIRDEGYSGKDLNRPGIQEIISGCKGKGFDVVVTLKLDRLTRSVKDLGHLIEDVFESNGVAFSSIQESFDTASANGRMILNVLASLAQWERDVISERTKDAMHFIKNGLKLTGAVPFGFDLVEEELRPNPREIKTLREMLKLKSEGVSYRKLAAFLNRKKLLSKNGRKWYPKSVMSVLATTQALPGEHPVIKKCFPAGIPYIESNSKLFWRNRGYKTWDYEVMMQRREACRQKQGK